MPASVLTERPWTTFSCARRPGSTLTVRVSRAAGFAAFPDPLGFGAAFGPAVFADTADVVFFAPDRTAGTAALVNPGAPAPRPDPLRALADVALGMFPTPTDLLRRRGREVVENFPDLLHEILGQARLGDERVAAGALGAFGDPRQGVARERDHRNRRRARVGLEPPRRFPAVHHRKRQVHQDDVGRLVGRLRQRLHAILGFDDVEAR